MAAATRFNGTTHSQKFTRKFVAFDKEVCKPVENQDAETMLWDPDRLPDLTVPQLQGFVEQHVVVLDTFKVAGLTNATSLRRNIGQYAVAYRSEFDRKTEQEIQQGQQRFRLEIVHAQLRITYDLLVTEHNRLRTERDQLQGSIDRRDVQLDEKDATLLDLKNNHEGKIKQMKNDRKSKEADYKELQEQLRTLENKHGITQGKLRVTTENLQETNVNRQKLVEEIKTKDREILSLKKQINGLENPDSKVYLHLAEKLIEKDKEELLLDHIREGRTLKQNTDFYENGLTALLHTGCDPDDITSTLCEINKKSIAVPKDKHDSEIKKVTDRYRREHESMEEKHRVARDESAANNTALQRVFVDNIAELKINIAELKNRLSVEEGKHHATETNLADVQLKYDAVKDETATESQLRTELETEKKKNQVLEGKNTELKLNLKLAYQEQDGDE